MTPVLTDEVNEKLLELHTRTMRGMEWDEKNSPMARIHFIDHPMRWDEKFSVAWDILLAHKVRFLKNNKKLDVDIILVYASGIDKRRIVFTRQIFMGRAKFRMNSKFSNVTFHEILKSK